jgi:hypothetical protein
VPSEWLEHGEDTEHGKWVGRVTLVTCRGMIGGDGDSILLPVGLVLCIARHLFLLEVKVAAIDSPPPRFWTTTANHDFLHLLLDPPQLFVLEPSCSHTSSGRLWYRCWVLH